MTKKNRKFLVLSCLVFIILISDLLFIRFSPSRSKQKTQALLTKIQQKDVVEIPNFTSNTIETLPKNKLFQVELIYVIDGDTIIFALNNQPIKCRLIGVDTPELQRNDRSSQPYALEATDFTREFLTQSSAIYLELEQGPSLDRYDRLLVHVFNQQRQLLQDELLSFGYAHFVDFYKQPNQYASLLKQSEQKAKDAELNIWHLKKKNGLALNFSTDNEPAIN